MSLFKLGKTKAVKLTALIVVLAALGLAALGAAFAQSAPTSVPGAVICVEYDLYGTCAEWGPNPDMAQAAD